MDGPDGNNLFALAIRRLLNSSLLAQRDKHLECERYERIPTRNTQTPFTPIIPEFERGSRAGDELRGRGMADKM